jgi:ribosome-associated protein
VETLKKLIESSLDSDKAEDIVTIDLAGKSDFADAMIIATGTSQRHINTLADHIVERMKLSGFTPLSIEGKESCDWVLVDAGNVIVHLFRPEARSLYNLEKMWAITLPASEAALAV